MINRLRGILMDNITKAAFNWIASTAIVIGLISQPAIAGERHHYKKLFYSSAHQHNPYCNHGYRQHFDNSNYNHRPKRHYNKQNFRNRNYNSGFTPRIRHKYNHGHRGWRGNHSGYRHRERGGSYIKISF